MTTDRRCRYHRNCREHRRCVLIAAAQEMRVIKLKRVVALGRVCKKGEMFLSQSYVREISACRGTKVKKQIRFSGKASPDPACSGVQILIALCDLSWRVDFCIGWLVQHNIFNFKLEWIILLVSEI
ncbi:glycoside hydrolase family 3 domain protein [Striga asiatica]|uniref:Glycoside hydrolase family 3 domain protein n=1 Tax=Striga asiatica TaxID=4170 RepID=A0A5A7RIB0_STRAF|nr:glycoside hydrolase family 3 domain protein [Striga asiatica]